MVQQLLHNSSRKTGKADRQKQKSSTAVLSLFARMLKVHGGLRGLLPSPQHNSPKEAGSSLVLFLEALCRRDAARWERSTHTTPENQQQSGLLPGHLADKPVGCPWVQCEKMPLHAKQFTHFYLQRPGKPNSRLAAAEEAAVCSNTCCSKKQAATSPAHFLPPILATWGRSTKYDRLQLLPWLRGYRHSCSCSLLPTLQFIRRFACSGLFDPGESLVEEPGYVGMQRESTSEEKEKVKQAEFPEQGGYFSVYDEAYRIIPQMLCRLWLTLWELLCGSNSSVAQIFPLELKAQAPIEGKMKVATVMPGHRHLVQVLLNGFLSLAVPQPEGLYRKEQEADFLTSSVQDSLQGSHLKR
ncbi:hypothetical protein Anapl_16756 [Anas platyrhynchos]|uniref:Uncharacterized protein n=1 Tax=Anas platyrhynchos TaxID=8839 RepID=R0L532_ANAPL|nr:hypothetical protein Anapl_16756 [Anas platyrhynchos]